MRVEKAVVEVHPTSQNQRIWRRVMELVVEKLIERATRLKKCQRTRNHLCDALMTTVILGPSFCQTLEVPSPRPYSH